MKILMLTILATSMSLVSCGRSPESKSKILEHKEVATDLISSGDVQSFLDQASAILKSQTRFGSIPVSAFIKLMPFENDDRETLGASYFGDFAVKCNTDDDICQASASGTPVQTVMPVTIDGISRPSLVLGSNVTSGFILRGTNGVEFCNTTGLSVKKFFIKMRVQGILLTVDNDIPKLIVNVGNDSENYTCMPSL